jgi:hypothetical protein
MNPSKIFAVAKLSFFDNDMQINFIRADNEFHAVKQVAESVYGISGIEATTYEEIKEETFDMDTPMAAKEIPQEKSNE